MHTRPSYEPPKRRPALPKPVKKSRLAPRTAHPERTDEDDPRNPAAIRSDDGEAFLHDPEGGPARTRDLLAETLAEEFLQSATSAQEVTEEVRDAIVPEELGGPFLQAAADEEFADDVDEANPSDAEKAAFPTAIRLDK
jgi:hypothetical protein